VDDEERELGVHGVLHLLNYDHADEREAESMQRRERELLERFRQLES
jgi:probable rRNA maturation factor